MTIKLYGFPISNYYNMAKVVMIEKGIEFEEVLVRPNQEADYLSKSPMGKVPSIETEQGFLTETGVIIDYLDRNALAVEKMSRGYAWLDSGTHERLLDASQYIATIEKRQGLKIACLEEIALRKGFIDVDAFRSLAQAYPKSSYGEYLRDLLKFGDL